MQPPADLAAKLGRIQIGVRDDVVVTRQQVGRGARYVFHDPITFQNHLFSVFEYQIVVAIVPERSLAATFARLVEAGTLSSDREDAFYGFILRLHHMGLLQLPIVESEKLFERYEARRDAQLRAWYRVFFYHKIPLLNPDQFLVHTQRFVGWIFSRTGTSSRRSPCATCRAWIRRIDSLPEVRRTTFGPPQRALHPCTRRDRARSSVSRCRGRPR